MRSGGDLVAAAVCAVGLGLSAVSATRGQASSSASQPPTWTLVWSDEFNGVAGSGVDTSNGRWAMGDGRWATG